MCCIPGCCRSSYDRELSLSNQDFLKQHRAAVAKDIGNELTIAGKNAKDFPQDRLDGVRLSYYRWSCAGTFTKIIGVVATVALGILISPTAGGIAAFATIAITFWSNRKVNQAKTWLNSSHVFEKQRKFLNRECPIDNFVNNELETTVFFNVIRFCLVSEKENVVDLYVNSENLDNRTLVTNLVEFIRKPKTDDGKLNVELFNKLEWIKTRTETFMHSEDFRTLFALDERVT